MKKRNAFTLLELSVATVISSFVMLSMASIYTAANKHVFQSYRSDAVKSGVSLSMRAIRNAMAQATIITKPDIGSTGTRLELASNVDPVSGCHPIVTTALDSGAPAPMWQLFCTVNTSNNIKLYYHYGTVGTACGCPGPCSAFNNPAATVTCGSGGGILLAQYLTKTDVFERNMANGPTGVGVKLQSRWNLGGSVNPTQHAVDYSLDAVFNVSYGRNW